MKNSNKEKFQKRAKLSTLSRIKDLQREELKGVSGASLRIYNNIFSYNGVVKHFTD